MIQNRISVLRREQGMNQKELGDVLGVGQTTVSAWETGKNEPDNESMHKMAQFFHVSIGYLAGYESDDLRRGLSKEEHEAVVREALTKRDNAILEREIKRDIEIDSYGGLEPEEIEEILEQELFEEWETAGKPGYIEFFKLNKYGDYLTKTQRERIVKVAQLMFPNVVKGLHTPE